MKNKLVNEKNILERLRRGLGDSAYKLVYQPQYDCRMNQVIGYEALLRFSDSEGMISPAVFIPIVEENELIHQLGKYVFGQICQDFNYLRAITPHMKKIAMNISPVQLEDENFYDFVSNALEIFDVDPRYLEFELTETIILNDYKLSKDILVRLTKLGITIALDDFGTGYSKLSQLCIYPVNTVKIDKSFIAQLESNFKIKIVLLKLVEMMDLCNISVVAEGIETISEFHAIQRLGIHIIQGYYCGYPQTLELLKGKNKSVIGK